MFYSFQVLKQIVVLVSARESCRVRGKEPETGMMIKESQVRLIQGSTSDAGLGYRV